MNLTHHFLISMPQMQDQCFKNSLVYILDHGEQGAFGVIINASLSMNLEELLAQINISIDHAHVKETVLLRGGPIDESHGLVLHEPGPTFETTRDFDFGVSLSSSRDVLEAIAKGESPLNFQIVLGHAGWAPGQLEMEIADNAWLTCMAQDTNILFNTPLHQRRQAVAGLLGVDLSCVVGQSGHA